jgi:methylthioribose-1-phosphate isomerase
MTEELRSIRWTGTAVRIIDQTALPHTLSYLDIEDVDGLVGAIRRLAVRGAPALGAAGALGVVLAMRQAGREGWAADRLAEEIGRLRVARPTASNLAWAVDQVEPLVAEGEAVVLEAALRVVADDEAANREIGRRGADWILERVARRPVRVLTHCNAGLLATTAWGSALGVVRELRDRGQIGLVYVDETRPLLQGARLTAWELEQESIPHLVQVDAAAASTILAGKVDVAIIGADRIAANGDTANKIGSLGVAIACHYAGIPFVVAAPESTVDLGTPTGQGIPIEMRDASEVVSWLGVPTAPASSGAHNPAFDVTPAGLVSVLVTERRTVEPAKGERPEQRPVPAAS